MRVVSKRDTNGNLYSQFYDRFNGGVKSTQIPVTAITSVLPRVGAVSPTRQMRLAGVFGPLNRLQRGLQPHLGASRPVVAAAGTNPNGAAVSVAKLTYRGAEPCDVPSPELELCLAGLGGDDGSGPDCRVAVAVFAGTHSATGARLCSVCKDAITKLCDGGARAQGTVVVVAHASEAKELIAAAKRPFYVTSVASVAGPGDVMEFSHDQIAQLATRKLNGMSESWRVPGYMHFPDQGISLQRRRAAFCSIFAVNAEERARVDAEVSSLEDGLAGAAAPGAFPAVDVAARAAQLHELGERRRTLLPTLPAELAAMICRIAFASDHALPAVQIYANSIKRHCHAAVFPCCGMVSDGDDFGALGYRRPTGPARHQFDFSMCQKFKSAQFHGCASNPAMVYDVMTDTVRAPRDGATRGSVDQPARPWELALPWLRPAVLPAEMTTRPAYEMTTATSADVPYTISPCDRRFVPPWGTPHTGKLELRTPCGGTPASARWTCCPNDWHNGDVTSRCTQAPTT